MGATVSGVRTYTEVNRVCIRDGYTPLLRAYYVLRHTSQRRRGWHTAQDANDTLVYALNITEKRASQLLRRGNGQFWKQSATSVYLFGIDRVAEILGLEKGPGDIVGIPEAAFSSVRAFSAWIYSAWFVKATITSVRLVTEDNVQKVVLAGYAAYSRETLRELFGITRNTQRTYEEIAGVEVIQQAVQWEPGMDIWFPEAVLNGQGGIASGYNDKQSKYIYVQTVNRYAQDLTFKRGRRRVKKSSDGPGPHGAEVTRRYRTFFHEKKAAVKAVSKGKTRHGVAYVRTDTFKELRKGQLFHILEAIAIPAM